MTSQFKSVLLLGLLTGLMLFMGIALDGKIGLVFAVALTLLMNLGGYWFSDKIALSRHRGLEERIADLEAMARNR